MTAKERYDSLVAHATETYGLVLEPKAYRWYWVALGKLMSIITLGKVDFMNSFFTTIFNRIGVTPSWESLSYEDKYEVLLHEVEHMKQYTWAGFGNIWLGQVIAGFGYLLFPLPIGLAWIRARMEMGGYAQSIRAIIQLRGVNAARANKERIVSQFTSVNYLFMWPFKDYMNSWFDDTVERIAAEEGL
jgi:hypothetical protein